jgi:cytochrome bd-type quinol oxidase subunit 2
LANLDNLQQALSSACEAASGAALNAAILGAAAFLIFAGVSFFAYKKYSASKSRKWLAALLVSSLIALSSLALAIGNFINFSNMGCP